MKQAILMLVIATVALSSVAEAQNLKLCVSSSGAIAAKRKCKRGETQASLATLGATQGPPGAAGPQGPQGPQGAPGTGGISEAGCTLRETNITSKGFGAGDAVCLVSEVFVSHGGYASTGSPYVVSIALLKQLKDSAKVAGVSYAFFDPAGGSFSATVQAYCCRRSDL